VGVFDQAGRYATLADAESVVARLLRDELVKLRFREWLDSRTTPMPGDRDRTADRVAALEDERASERPWLVVFEFQSRHDADKLDVTLAEAARLRIEVRHGEDRQGKYRVAVGMVYLRGTCPEVTLDMTLPSGRGTRHSVFAWNVAEDDALAALDDFASARTTWGILFWVALMKGGSNAEVIRLWLILVRTVPVASRRAELCHIALVFAELAGCLVAWQDALEGAEMETESQVVNAWIAKAEQRKELETMRAALIRMLERKFPGQVTAEVLATIKQQPGLALLQAWFDEAIDAITFADFVAVLRR
jgi:hypothetical protein